MVTYIYFVQCPGCETEHFDFFDEAKEFALGRLSQKPIITQTEVCRNDFGECIDHCDLGTVWSWEDMMNTEVEPAVSVFTHGDFKEFNPDNDPEFTELDNSVEPEEVTETSEISPIERKPIPEGMTIEQLVEEMEENEDTVECTWCNELFGKDQCRKEVDLGWLCGRCEAAIKSRGETLTFRENDYWDFLDEDIEDSDSEAETLHDLGNTYDGGYPVEDDLTEGWQDETVDLYYDSLTAEVCIGYKQPYFDRSFGNWLPGEDITEEVTQSYTYKAPKWKVEEFLWEQLSDEYLEANFPGGCANLDNDSVVEEFTAAHLEEWIKTYNKELLEYFEEDAATAFANEYDPSDYYPEYDESLKSPTSKSVLEELEDSETYHARLTTCPECGEAAFDPETGICNNCGFNIL